MKKYQNKATAKYRKSHMTSISIRLHNENDREVLAQLNRVENKTDYLRQLILNDINK